MWTLLKVGAAMIGKNPAIAAIIALMVVAAFSSVYWWIDHKGYERGVDHEVAVWNKAIAATARAGAAAQTGINTDTQKIEANRTKSVSAAKTALVEGVKAIQDSTDEHQAYLATRSAVERVRVACDLPILDLAVDPNSG